MVYWDRLSTGRLARRCVHASAYKYTTNNSYSGNLRVCFLKISTVMGS